MWSTDFWQRLKKSFSREMIIVFSTNGARAVGYPYAQKKKKEAKPGRTKREKQTNPQL